MLLHKQVKERMLLLGLKFESQEQCLTEQIDDVEVDGGAVAAFGLGTSGAGNKPEVNTMQRFLLCRRCGWGAHSVAHCTARTGTKNAASRIMSESAQDFERLTHLLFKGRSWGTFTQNHRGGAYSTGRGRSGGRGTFPPQRNDVNAV